MGKFFRIISITRNKLTLISLLSLFNQNAMHCCREMQCLKHHGFTHHGFTHHGFTHHRTISLNDPIFDRNLNVRTFRSKEQIENLNIGMDACNGREGLDFFLLRFSLDCLRKEAVLYQCTYFVSLLYRGLEGYLKPTIETEGTKSLAIITGTKCPEINPRFEERASHDQRPTGWRS